MQLALPAKRVHAQCKPDLEIRLTSCAGDEAGMLRIALGQSEPVVPQPPMNGFFNGLPDRGFLHVQRSDRHEDLNPQTRHRQRPILLDCRQQRQHFRLVGNFACERLDDGVLHGEPRAIRAHHQAIDAAILLFVGKRQDGVFPRALFIGRNENPDDMVFRPRCCGQRKSSLLVKVYCR